MFPEAVDGSLYRRNAIKENSFVVLGGSESARGVISKSKNNNNKCSAVAAAIVDRRNGD